MTLHRLRDHTESQTGPVGNPCISGRTLIACQNCASAKTGCDKKIPCSRCIEKHLQCTARYARRASKAAIRAAQAATKDQMISYDFRPQQFQNSSISSATGNCHEHAIRNPIQHVHGSTDQQHDDNIWDILNPISPLSGYSVAAPSLASSSSYSDSLNLFERRQSSPVPIGISKFSTDINIIDNDVSIRMQKSHRSYQGNMYNSSNNLTSFSDTSSLQELKNYASFVEIPDGYESTYSVLGGLRNPEFDIINAPNEPERPNQYDAITWMRKLRQKGLFDSHTPDITGGESTSSYRLLKTESPNSSRNRLAYTWVQMDQELSLFYDIEQTLSASDLEIPLPDPSFLGNTRSILKASSLYMIDGLYQEIKTEEVLGYASHPTLNQMLKDLLHGTLTGIIPPRHLQLVLHPLQALVRHSQGLLSWANCSHSPVLSNTTNSNLLETQRLLRAWYNLAMEASNESTYMHDTRLGLILYHFIGLNQVASFPDIERLASRENLSTSFWQQSLQNERCIRNRREALFHCGQALRHLRAVNADTRPWWWPTAVHRAILTLWAISILGPGPNNDEPKETVFSSWHQGSMGTDPETNMLTPEVSFIAIDYITPENHVFSDPEWSEKHMLVLSCQDEGGLSLTDAMGILQYGISLVNSLPSSFEGEAVIAKLKDVGQAWEGSSVCYQD